LNLDRSPICGQRPDVILEPAIQKPLTHFSMVSHGFGTLAMVSMLDALNAYVHESVKLLERHFPQAAGGSQILGQGDGLGGSQLRSHHQIFQ